MKSVYWILAGFAIGLIAFYFALIIAFAIQGDYGS